MLFPRSRITHTAPTWLPLILAAACALPTLWFDFVQDDHILILENPSLGTWSGVRDALTKDYFHRPGYQGGVGYYRPLTRLSLVVDHAVWGTTPLGYHLTNVVWALLTVLVASRLFSLILGARGSIWASLFFACHPVRAQAVAIVTARSDLLATALALGAALAWVRGSRPWSGVLLFLASCGKESALALVPLLGLWSLASIGGSPRARSWETWLSLLLPAVAYGALRVALGLEPPGHPQEAIGALREAGRVLAFYLRALVWPLNLPQAPLVSVGSPTWCLPLVLVPWAVLLAFWRPLSPGTRAGLTWTVVCLLPMLVPSAMSRPSIPHFLAPSPRFLPLASAGVSMLWAELLIWSARFLRPWRLVGVLWTGLLAAQLLEGTRWLANDSLISQVVLRDWERVPPRARTRQFQRDLLTFKASVLRDQGSWDEAEAAYRQVVELDPNSLVAHLGLAGVLQVTGRDSQAVAHLASVLDPAQIPRWHVDHYLRGYVAGASMLVRGLLRLGRPDEAVAWARMAVAQFPTSWKAHRLLAEALWAAGQADEARSALEQAFRLAPRGPVRDQLEDLGRALGTAGQRQP